MLAVRSLSETITRSELLPIMAVLVGILIVLLLIAFWIRNRFYKNRSENAANPEEMLILYEEMRRQGQITDSEFRSIKGQILPSRSHTPDLESDD